MPTSSLHVRKLSVRNGFLICLLLFVSGIIVWQFIPNEEDKILADIKALASAGTPAYINQFDFICLSQSSNYKQEFLSAGDSAYQKSLQACGVGGSCCNNASDANIIGLGRAHQMKCIEVRRFDYWLANDRPLCAAPNALKVELQTANNASNLSGRPRFNPSRASYRIGKAEYSSGR